MYGALLGNRRQPDYGLWVTIRGEASDQYLEMDEVFFTQLKRLTRSKARFLWISNLALLDSAEKDLGI